MPITIDGTTVQNITIDGTSVTEVTADGDVVFSTTSLASSAVHQYDAQALSLTDGDTVDPFPDEIGTEDAAASNTSPSYDSAGINSNAAVSYTNSGDHNATYGTSISQPFTASVVFRLDNSDRNPVFGGDSNDVRFESEPQNDRYILRGGNSVSGGSPTQNPEIGLIIFDGANSKLRINGADELTGDFGTLAFDGVSIGTDPGDFRQYSGDVGELVIFDERLSSTEISNEEQRLSDKWGITI